MGLTVGKTPSTTTTAVDKAKKIPPSIQAELTESGKKEVRELYPFSVIHAAETTHAPGEGMVSGLDLDELKVIGEVAPEKMEEYERMRESKINRIYLQLDRDSAGASLRRAQERYDAAARELEGNWFLNIFRSKKTKAEQQARFDGAISDLRYAEQLYTLQRRNVISYRTILDRNEGEKY